MSKTGSAQALEQHENFLAELWAEEALSFMLRAVGMVEAASVAREGGWQTDERNRRARTLLEHVLQHRIHPHDRAKLEAKQPSPPIDERGRELLDEPIPLKDALAEAMSEAKATTTGTNDAKPTDNNDAKP